MRNIEVSYFETLDEVKQHILNIVPLDSSIGIGHSATLQKMNITNSLIKRGNRVYDKELAETKEECKFLTCFFINVTKFYNLHKI